MGINGIFFIFLLICTGLPFGLVRWLLFVLRSSLKCVLPCEMEWKDVLGPLWTDLLCPLVRISQFPAGKCYASATSMLRYSHASCSTRYYLVGLTTMVLNILTVHVHDFDRSERPYLLRVRVMVSIKSCMIDSKSVLSVDDLLDTVM
jgi:hypothetical protein